MQLYFLLTPIPPTLISQALYQVAWMMLFLFALPALGWEKYEPICEVPCEINWAGPINKTECYVDTKPSNDTVNLNDSLSNGTNVIENLNTTFVGGCMNSKAIKDHNHKVRYLRAP